MRYPGREKNDKTSARRLDMLRRPGFLYVVFALLITTNAMTGTALVMTPELAAVLDNGKDKVATAYEERILQLRMEVDRLHSRQYRQQGDLNLQVQELTQQQEFLAEQHRYVRALAERAKELGLGGQDMEVATAEPAVLETSSLSPMRGESIEEISSSIDRMLDESRMALDSISEAADQSTDEIVTELSRLGLAPDFETATRAGVGGPLLPAANGRESDSLARHANIVMEELQRFALARDSLDAAPIHYPFATRQRMSSRYGNRRDPFGGKVAFHSGVDFAAPSGTSVLSAGDGRVAFAARRSGYGNVVEIEHAGGIITRYAHLSRILVREGQEIGAGDIIARVGSTGRSTGPHLHFEVRRNDRPENPAPFLEVSRRLTAYLG